jgi:hypothetical protein
MTIFNSTFNYTRMISTFLGSQTDGGSALALRGGRYNVNSTVQGISFFPNSSNNYASGSTIAMYGVRS